MRGPARNYNARVAQALLISTLLTIAGLVVTVIMGFQATPVKVADHILVALVTTVAARLTVRMTLRHIE